MLFLFMATKSTHTHIYIYIYIEREREREGGENLSESDGVTVINVVYGLEESNLNLGCVYLHFTNALENSTNSFLLPQGRQDFLALKGQTVLEKEQFWIQNMRCVFGESLAHCYTIVFFFFCCCQLTQKVTLVWHKPSYLHHSKQITCVAHLLSFGFVNNRHRIWWMNTLYTYWVVNVISMFEL